MVNASAVDLCRFVDASPTPFHVVRTAAAELEAAGFQPVEETDAWPTTPGRYYVERAGSLIAWSSPQHAAAHSGFRIVGAHTDSPNLRLKQHHDLHVEGLGVVALEPYGGAIVQTWLDRDLALAGRLVLRDGREVLVHVEEPVLRVPHLAIHLDRSGSEVDRQRHLNAIWSGSRRPFLRWVAERAEVAVDQIAGFELMAADATPSQCYGAAEEFIAAPRLDNQATCFAGLRAFLAAENDGPEHTMLVLFDHEEVGSTSERGAQSDLLATVIERIVLSAGGGREDYHRAIAASVCVSGDMAHATHPNYVEKHEPLHRITMGGGPVLKVNQNLRYATDARGTAVFAQACEEAGVPLQRYVHRADLPCGSTIGPLSAARTGILTVDVGAPQLAMHSMRETMAVADIEQYARALAAFLTPLP